MVFIAHNNTFAIPASPHPIKINQPDGSEITLFIRGDEFFHWYEDNQGYTVIEQDQTFFYARLDGQQRLTPTSLQVGKDDPTLAELQPILITRAEIRQVVNQNRSLLITQQDDHAPLAQAGGTMKNLTILMRFSDHVDRTLPSNEDIDVLFNAVGGDLILAPTGSVRDVYLENSYGQLSLDSTIVGWVDLPNTESFYANNSSGLTTRIWSAIRAALEAADSSTDFSQFDQDNNGWIDAIAFIHSGHGAEWGGRRSPNRIWSHKWAIPTWTSDEGVKVSDYHISPGLWGASGSNIGRIGVICHETGHFIGLPDLYDTNGGGEGLGSYGMMANSWGFDGSQLHPPHFSAWSKIQLGWTIPTLIDSGTYNIAEAEFNSIVYKITNGFPNNEYLLIENRQPVGIESVIPQGGLCIWHIDEGKCCNTDEGFPGQTGWPRNNRHYRVAVLQADGNYNLERGSNRGDSGDLYHGDGVSTIGINTSPSTDRYQNGIVSSSGNTISDISPSGSVMSFTYSIVLPSPLHDQDSSSAFACGGGTHYGLPCSICDSGPRSGAFCNSSTECSGGFCVADSSVCPGSTCGTTSIGEGIIYAPWPKSRYIGVRANPGWAGKEVAIRVTLEDIAGFTSCNGEVRWLGPPIWTTSNPPFYASPLQSTPHFMDWTTIGLVQVYGEEIIPESRYSVQALDVSNFDLLFDETLYSKPSLMIETAQWGDVVNPLQIYSSSTQPTIGDVLSLVDKWLGGETISSARSQLQPQLVNPSIHVGIADVLNGVDAWLGAPYPFTITSCP